VIVNASCNFRVPLVYPGTVEVRMWLGDPGRTSVGSFYEIWKDDRQYADGAAKIVWIDLATGRPAPLPDPITAPLRATSG
jgi:acyl-CoA thioester hydrolase